MDVIDERDFARFEFKMHFGGILHMAPGAPCANIVYLRSEHE